MNCCTLKRRWRSLKINKETLKKWSKEIISTALMIFIIANAISFFRAPQLESTCLPELNTILTNQELFSTQDFQGEAVLIHFWATWCPVCKLEASNIQTISEHFNVITVAVKSGEDEIINTYLKNKDLNYKVINDEEGILAQEYDIPAYPTTLIYNKEGNLSFAEVGYTSTWSLYLRMWWASL